MTGLLCGLIEYYYLYSNPEAGHGRADVILVPRDQERGDAVIMEFKRDTHSGCLAYLSLGALDGVVDACGRLLLKTLKRVP